MALKARENLFSAWALLVGVVIALIGGILLSFGGQANPFILGVLLVLGLLLGFFVEINQHEASTFMLASLSLVIVSFAGQQGIANIQFGEIALGNIIASTLSGLLVMLVPATIVVAIRSIFLIARR
ncbi:MAG: hypothetical protein AABW79_04705 [Nanoarchaeota archaeon]